MRLETLNTDSCFSVSPKEAQVSLGVGSNKGAQVFQFGALQLASPLPPSPNPYSSVNDTTQVCGQRDPGGKMDQNLMYMRRGREKVPVVYPITWTLSVTEFLRTPRKYWV